MSSLSPGTGHDFEVQHLWEDRSFDERMPEEGPEREEWLGREGSEVGFQARLDGIREEQSEVGFQARLDGIQQKGVERLHRADSQGGVGR